MGRDYLKLVIRILTPSKILQVKGSTMFRAGAVVVHESVLQVVCPRIAVEPAARERR